MDTQGANQALEKLEYAEDLKITHSSPQSCDWMHILGSKKWIYVPQNHRLRHMFMANRLVSLKTIAKANSTVMGWMRKCYSLTELRINVNNASL